MPRRRHPKQSVRSQPSVTQNQPISWPPLPETPHDPNEKMTARDRLRALIDQLEDCYASMPQMDGVNSSALDSANSTGVNVATRFVDPFSEASLTNLSLIIITWNVSSWDHALAVEAEDTLRYSVGDLWGVVHAVRTESDLSSARRAIFQLHPDHVPADIWIMIFEFTCLADFNPYEKESCFEDFQKTRKAITLTCSRWRQVALAMSSLWNKVGLICRADSLTYGSSRWSGSTRIRISFDVVKSRNRPLALFLHTDYSGYTNRVFTVLPRYLHHCYYLSFKFTGGRGGLNSFGGAQMPSLQTLIVECVLDSNDPVKPTFAPYKLDLTRAPALENLWINLN